MLMSEQMSLSSRDMPDIACSAAFALGLWHREYRLRQEVLEG